MTPATLVFFILVVVSVVTGHVYDDLSLYLSLAIYITICPIFGEGGGRILILPLIVFTKIHCKCVRAFWAYLVVLVSSVFCLLITLATFDPFHLSSPPPLSLSLSMTLLSVFVDVGRILLREEVTFRQNTLVWWLLSLLCVYRISQIKKDLNRHQLRMNFQTFLARFSFVCHSRWFRFVCSNQLWRGRRKILSSAENSHSLKAGRISPRKVPTKSVS